MKVLLFSNLFPIPRDPSRGVFVAQLAQALNQRCLVQALVPLPWVPDWAAVGQMLPSGASAFQGLPSAAKWGGVEATYVRYPMVPKLGRRWQARLLGRAAMQAARQLHRRHGFDLINAHWLDPDGIAAVRVARRLGVPLVLSARGCDVNLNLQYPQSRELVLRAVRAAAAVTTVSEQLKEALVDAGIPASQVTAIPNGVDTSHFHPHDRDESRHLLGLPTAGQLVVCVSRLSGEKGVDVLVEAMADPAMVASGATLALVGAGPLDQALTARASALGVREAIRFVGAVPHADVARWFAAADLCCLPSLREGYPNVVLEALACGRPVVASRVGAIPDMVTPASGILVQPADATGLARALVEGLSRTWDGPAIAGSVEGMSWDRTAAAYLDVYQSVLDVKPHTP